MIYFWGSNPCGIFGNGIDRDYSFPIPSEPLPFTQIVAGSRSVFGITDDLQLYASGSNDSGQLGTGPNSIEKTNRFVKVPFKFGKVKQIACGWAHTLLLTDEGRVYACGDGRKGQLGFGTETISAESFIEISEIEEKVIQISCGVWSSFALLENGKILFWGQFRSLNAESIYYPLILRETLDIFVTKFAVGHKHLLLLNQEERAFGIGCNKYGQIQVNHDINDVIDIFTGWNHSVLRLKSNELILFGKNDHNQLAHPDPKCQRNVISFKQDGIVEMAVGSDHALLLTERRKELLAWGWNEHGVLGQNHTDQVYGPPLKINFNEGIIDKIFCGTASSSITTL